MIKTTKQSNPLLPLIVLLMLIILLTVIASNLTPATRQDPFSGISLIPEIPETSVELRWNGEVQMLPEVPSDDQIIRTAIMNWKTGKVDEAESDFRTILVFDPEHPAALSFLGIILYYRGKFQDAEFLFRKKNKIMPYSPSGYKNLAIVLFRQKRIQDSIVEMKRATALAPDDTENLLILARLYAYAGDPHNAAICLKRSQECGADLTEILKEPLFLSLKNESFLWNLLNEKGTL